jgi:predicted ATPase
MGEAIKKITIEGFKSIRSLKDFDLRPLNVLIGANGAGKSNFVGFFSFLRELIEQRLQLAVAKGGGADAFLYMGRKFTKQIIAKLFFGDYGYEIALEPAGDRLVFASERPFRVNGREEVFDTFGSGHFEAQLKDRKNDYDTAGGVQWPSPYVYEEASGWVVYHFDDTSDTAAVRRWSAINDSEYLRPDASNLAAFLFGLKSRRPANYNMIRDVVRLAAPFFDDFRLRPAEENTEFIRLEWTQKGSDYPFQPHQLSDGTLRFICLATALIQPSPPSTVLFDEPELGLHPYALTLLAALFRQATHAVSSRRAAQVIVSTQSAALLDEFAPEDVVVVERGQGQSSFERLDGAALAEWLQEYSLGELWQKNVLGGRPQQDATAPPRQSLSRQGNEA